MIEEDVSDTISEVYEELNFLEDSDILEFKEIYDELSKFKYIITSRMASFEIKMGNTEFNIIDDIFAPTIVY